MTPSPALRDTGLQGRGIVEEADDVAGFAAGAVGDLMPTAGPAGGEPGFGGGRGHFWEGAQLARPKRQIVMFGLETERPGHAAASRVEGLDLELGDQL